MAKMVLTIEVVEVTRKGEHLGYKVYISDFLRAAKLPRKPGDLNRKEHPELSHPTEEPVDYYTGTLIETVQQAFIDWQIWKDQGYRPD